MTFPEEFLQTQNQLILQTEVPTPIITAHNSTQGKEFKHDGCSSQGFQD